MYELIPIIIPLIFGYLTETIILKLFTKLTWKKILWYTLLINAATMPIANLLFGFTNIIYAELFAIIAEIFLIKYLFNKQWGKSILISTVINIASVSIGFILSFSGLL